MFYDSKDRFQDHQIELQQHSAAAARPSKLRPTDPPYHTRRTGLLTWLCALTCALFWSLVILGGVAVLTIYLSFRPKSPRFEISSATLNAAYLDAGARLNADLTILANFSNPNRRVEVHFREVAVELYFEGALLAAQGVEPFSERARESALKSVHMVASEVALSGGQAERWRREVGGTEGVIRMEVEGRFRMRSDFVGTFLRPTYELYGRCGIAVGRPPSGVLLSSNCTTKR